MERLSEDLPRIAHLPALLRWGPKDMFYKQEDLRRFQGLFSDNTTRILEGAGHFSQSEAGDEIATLIKQWSSST